MAQAQHARGTRRQAEFLESREDRRLALDLIKSMQPEAVEAGTSMLENLNDQPRRVTIELQRKIALMTPAECTWQAITWSPPKESASYRPFNHTEVIVPLVEPGR